MHYSGRISCPIISVSFYFLLSNLLLSPFPLILSLQSTFAILLSYLISSYQIFFPLKFAWNIPIISFPILSVSGLSQRSSSSSAPLSAAPHSVAVSWQLRRMPDTEMETVWDEAPVWKHDEHITTLWVNPGPPCFALSPMASSPSPAAAPSSSLARWAVPLRLFMCLLCLWQQAVFAERLFTPPPTLPHPSAPLNLWPRQPHLPTPTTHTHTFHTSHSVSFAQLWRQTPFSAANWQV